MVTQIRKFFTTLLFMAASAMFMLASAQSVEQNNQEITRYAQNEVVTFGTYLGYNHINHNNLGDMQYFPTTMPSIGVYASYGLEIARFHVGIGIYDINAGFGVSTKWFATDLNCIYVHYKRAWLVAHLGPKLNLFNNSIELKLQYTIGTNASGHLFYGARFCMASKLKVN